MRGRVLLITGIALLGGAEPAIAGLYNTSEPRIIPGKEFDADGKPRDVSFLDQLRMVRGYGPPDMITIMEPTKHRLAYLAKVEELRKKEAASGLTLEEQSDLGAYLIQLLRYEEATNVLRAALRKAEENTEVYFRLNANLGTLWMRTGELGQAVNSLQVAESQARRLKLPDQVYERHQLALAQKRVREREEFGDRFRGREPLDAIFDARFVGPGGKWEPGVIAEAEQRKLPNGSIDDAIRIVQELLLCLPEDARLHWLLGELANAKGDFRGALAAMNVAVQDLRLSTPQLKDRRLLLDQCVMWEDMVDRLMAADPGSHWFQRIGRGHPAYRAELRNRWLAGMVGAGLQLGAPGAIELPLAPLAARIPPAPQLELSFAEEPAVPPYDPFGDFGWKAWLAIGLGAVFILALLFFQIRQVIRRAAGRSKAAINNPVS